MISSVSRSQEIDLDAIEKEMKKIIKKGAKIERFHKDQREDDDFAFFKEKNEPYTRAETDRGSSGRRRDLLLFSGRPGFDLCAGRYLNEHKGCQSIQAAYLLQVLTGEVSENESDADSCLR